MSNSLYPAFQFLFQVQQADSLRYDVEVFGAEALARSNLEEAAFELPADLSWAALDLRMAGLLQQNVEALPALGRMLFVNVSQESLESNDGFFRWLSAASRLRHALDAEQKLAVEIREDIDTETLRQRWTDMKQCGLKLAMDDYGVGLSTAERLQMFPWDFCKFDLSALSHDQVVTAVDYCWRAKITGIAEKVETHKQSRIAFDQGLHIQQGYLFGRPITKNLTYRENVTCAKVS